VALEIRPVGDGDSAARGALLAARHAQHRAAVPLLSERGVEPPADGLVAVRDGRPVAYLSGEVRENEFWGAHAWVGLPGHAASEPEALRDLYAAAAPAWVEAGARLHLALVPAVPELMDPWLRLGFGLMQAHGIRESGGAVTPPGEGIVIRFGGRDDLATVVEHHGGVLWRHQAASPVFTGLQPPPAERVLADWMETFDDPGDTLLLAERGGELLAHSLLYRPSPELGMPGDAISQAVVVVRPGLRGQGIGRALVERSYAWAREAGYGSIVTDWRVANLEASRFWPARGFQVAYFRMYRMVGIG
jgi:GNAT superfamily N-acetyltransferase